MTKILLIAAIASLSLVNPRFASAQAAISEPGAYAFYHPNGDVLHAGSGNYDSRAEHRDATPTSRVAKPARGHRQARTQ
jgi:hypothetical protein